MALSLCAVGAFAESAEPDVATFEALAAANTGEAILARHANMEMDRATFKGGEEILSERNYRDADTYQWRCSDGNAMLRLSNLWVDRHAEHEGVEAYTEVIFDTMEYGQYAFETLNGSAIIIIPETETLLETVDAGDGTFVAVTQNADPEIVALALGDALFAGGYEYAEGMTLRYEYAFDEQTSDVLSVRTELTDADGETLMTQLDSFAYDVENYDPFAEGEPFAEYDAAAKDPERSRTVSVVFSPDTENERGVECVLPQTAYIHIFLDGRYVEQEEVYTDRECTRPFEGSDGVEDLVLYVK